MKFIQVQFHEIKKHINFIAELRISAFKDFPYLYDGTIEYEEKYLKRYCESKNSVAILVQDNNKIVGVITGCPLKDEDIEFQSAFTNQGMNINDFFYIGECILTAEYQGRGLFRQLLSKLHKHAKNNSIAKRMVGCVVMRDQNHPRRPANYVPIESKLKRNGFRIMPDVIAHYYWKDIDQINETSHPMQFWEMIS